MSVSTHANLTELAAHLRGELEKKQFVLIFGYNGVGKTRLSTAFKDIGKTSAGDAGARDTLYYNAFTEDLFTWDNDLEGDSARTLKMNSASRFFAALPELEMENRIGPLLSRYANFDFRIDYEDWTISFSREVSAGDVSQTIDNIKVSRSEENIFIWCFFLAIVQLVLDGAEAYQWVQYIYIDDPISSLDEHNAIEVANHLAGLLRGSEKALRVVISSHHVLFFNVLCNEFQSKAHRQFMKGGQGHGSYVLEATTSRPFFHHLSNLVELNEAQKSGALATYHFNMLRRVMEQTAGFFGLESWTDCIGLKEDEALYKRIIDLMSHGDYSLYEPREMMDENKAHFRRVFLKFVADYPFDKKVLSNEAREAAATP